MTTKIQRPETKTLRRVAWFFGVVVTLLLAVLVFAFYADHGYLKNQVQARVSEALGRNFAINGRLHVDLGRMIVIEAENVELASTEWTQHRNLAELDRLLVEVDSRSLFNGPIVIANLEVSGLRVYAEERSGEENNWTLFDASEEAAPEPEERARMPVRFAAVSINDNQFEYLRQGAAPFRARLQRLSHAVDASGKVDVVLRGDINDTALNVDLGIDQISNFVDMRNVGFNLVGNIGEIKFDGDLKLEDLLDPSRPNASFHLSGPNVEYLGDVFQIPVVTTGSLDFNFAIQPRDEYLQLSLTGVFGEFNVSANGHFDDLRDLQNAELHAEAGGPDASVVAKLLGVKGFPADPFEFSTNATLTGRALKLNDFAASVGRTLITAEANIKELSSPDGATAHVRLEVPELSEYDAVIGLEGRVDGPLKFDATLAARPGGGADVVVDAAALGGRFAATGYLRAKDDFIGSVLNTEVGFADSSRLFRFLEIEAGPTDKLSVTAQISRQPGAVALDDGRLLLGADEISFSGVRQDASSSGSLAAQFQLRVANLRQRLVELAIDGHEKLPGGPLVATGNIELLGRVLTIRDLTAKFAKADLTVSGDIKTAGESPGADLRVTLTGAALSSLLSDDSPPEALNKPFRFAGHVRLDNQRLDISAIEAGLGNLKMSGSLNTDIGAEVLRLGVNVNARSPNLMALLPPKDSVANQEAIPLAASVVANLDGELWHFENVDMKAGRTTLVLSGVFDKWPDSSRTDLKIALSVPDISKFGHLAGIEWPADAARADFRLLSKQNELRAEGFRISVGDSDLSGDLAYTSGPVPRLNLAVQSKLLDVARYMPVSEDEEEAVEPPPSDGRVIPDTPLPFDKLKLLNANIQIDIAALRVRYQQLQDFTVRASILDGALSVEKISMVGANGGRMNARIGINPTKDGAEVGMRVDGANITIGLPALTPDDRRVLPRYEIKLALIATGATPRALASSANGYAKFVSGPGRLKVGLMRIFTQDFMFELLNTLNPFYKNDPYTDLQCAVMLATVERGQVLGDPAIVLLTDKLKVVAKTSIDLGKESLDVDIRTVAQKGLGISIGDLVNPYIKVGGTLAAPVLQFDPESAMLQGGAAVATGGISILALNLKNRFLSDKDPCGKAIADAQEDFDALEQKYGAKRN